MRHVRRIGEAQSHELEGLMEERHAATKPPSFAARAGDRTSKAPDAAEAGIQSALDPSAQLDGGVVTETQRNGSITGMGIVLGFSLTFTGQWSLTPGSWRVLPALAMGVACLGIALQLFALFRVLSLPLASLERHREALKNFAVGVGFVLAAFVAHVLLDFAIDVLKWRIP